MTIALTFLLVNSICLKLICDSLMVDFSGLKINLKKSEIVPIDKVKSIVELAQEFGCKVGMLLSFYLGLLLGGPFLVYLNLGWC